MILYFLRHGDAGEPWDANDDDRPLTAEGVARLQAAAPIWRRMKLAPDVVISSPLPRALRSAELLCDAIGGDPVTDDRLRPGASWDLLASAINAYPEADRVALVGHEPDLSAAIAALSGAKAVRMRKGGLACIEFSGEPERGAGEIAWLLDPDLYASG